MLRKKAYNKMRSTRSSRIRQRPDGLPELNLEDVNIVIVIPAYNEERFIGSVVLRARKYSPTCDCRR